MKYHLFAKKKFSEMKKFITIIIILRSTVDPGVTKQALLMGPSVLGKGIVLIKFPFVELNS